MKPFNEFLTEIEDFMTLHAGSNILTHENPSTLSWIVTWIDPTTNEVMTEEFSVSREDIAEMLENMPKRCDSERVKHEIIREATTTSRGRHLIGQGMIQPSRLRRRWRQSCGIIPSNSPREEELARG